ncbi:MAG: hypothetical protein HY079_09135 [Elusimicrobia bacterium]|nr:hypothetical protein [Elusimicrobiota bacterium]
MADDLKPLVAAGFLWYLLTIGAYSMIGPARDALLMTRFGPSSLPWVYLASATLTGAVVWGYSRFARASRRRLIGGALAFLAVSLGGGAAASAVAGWKALSFFYFLWCDVFGIMAVTLFWTYADDVFSPSESSVAFGPMAAAAPVGTIAGTWAVKRFVLLLGPAAMLAAAAGVFALTVPIFLFMESRARGRGKAGGPPGSAAPEPAAGVVRTILASKFLVWLAVLVALERLVPDLTKFVYDTEAARAFAGDARGMAAFFAGVDLWTGLGSFVAGALLAGPALRTLGVGGCLATASLANLALFVLFPAYPGLRLAAAVMALEGVARYTWFKTAKESTYTATDKDTLYRVKAFIEMFVYRFARGGAGFLLLGARAGGLGETGVALLGVPFALVWLWSAARVSGEHAALSPD